MPAATRLDAELLNAAFNMTRIGVCFVDDGGRFIEVNPAFAAMIGRAREELVGAPWTVAAPPEVAQHAARFLRAVLTESSKLPDQWKVRHRDGGTFDALVSFRALTRGDGRTCAVLTFTDISDRIGTERRLREVETRFRQIADNVREVLWITDPAKSQMLYVSPAYERVWGRTVDSLHREPLSFVEAIHPEDRKRVVAAFARQAAGEYDEIYRVVRPDGGVRWIRDRAFPVKDDAGRVHRITGVATDITDTKLAEEEARHLHAELERRIAERTELIRNHRNVLLDLAALDKSDKRPALEAILGADAATLGVERVSYWSLASGGAAIRCEALYVLSRRGTDAPFVGTRLDAADYPLYFSAILENRPVAANRAQTDPATHEFAAGYLRPLGITSMLDVPVWSQGKVVGVICHEHVGAPRDWSAEEIDFASAIASMVSITLEAARRRELLDALSASEEKYRRVVENASEAIVVAQDGYIRYANSQTTRLAGYAPEDLLNTPFLDFVHADDRALVRDNYVRRVRGEPADASYEFRVVKKSGEVRWLSINAVLLEWEGRPATLNFLTDTTERRRADEEVRKALEKERELNELKSRFVAMTSHEFRTPLSTILSSSELLEQYGERFQEQDRKELYGSIRTAVERMTHMLDNVLTIGRAEAQRLEFAPAPTDLAAFCRTLADEMRLAAGAGHTIEYSYEGARIPVSVDGRLLRHVLVNLLSNALKYSPQGGAVEFRVNAGARSAVFEVNDHGIGIPAEDQPRLFETFHRARNVSNISGTGLGLAIVKKSLELHGGVISFESAAGAGSRFRVEIPLS